MSYTEEVYKKLMKYKSFRESTPRTREDKLKRALARRRRTREDKLKRVLARRRRK